MNTQIAHAIVHSMHIRNAQETDIEAWSTMRTALWPDTNDAHMGEIQAYFDGTSIDIVHTAV